jgi:hypothetical protein
MVAFPIHSPAEEHESVVEIGIVNLYRYVVDPRLDPVQPPKLKNNVKLRSNTAAINGYMPFGINGRLENQRIGGDQAFEPA